MSSIAAGTTTTTGYVVSSDTTGALVLKTGASATTAVTIDTSQNVGIGTGSPVAKLDVQGILAVSNSGASYWAFDRDNSSGSLTFGDTGTQRMELTTTGNLGLGVTPSTLDIGRTIQVGFNSNTIWGATANNFQFLAGATYNNAYLYAVTGAAVSNYRQNAGQHQWYNAPSGTAGNTITFTQAMTLDASGRLGIKQTSPDVDLDIGANDDNVAVLSVRYSTVPAYLSNSFDGVSGLTTLSCNSYNSSDGSASWSSFKNTGYGNSAIQLAANAGSSDIRFLTAAAANTNPSERARIDSSGNLLVGTTSVAAGAKTTIFANSSSSTDASYLTLAGSAENIGDINYTNAFGIMVRLRGTKAGGGGLADEGYFEVRTASNGTLTGGVYVTSGGTSWVAVSDERKKTDLVPIEQACAKVLTLRAVTGRYFDDKPEKRRSFLIAQDVQAVLPEAVFESTNNDESVLGLAYTDTIPLLVAAIKEQQAIIQQLQADVAALKGTA